MVLVQANLKVKVLFGITILFIVQAGSGETSAAATHDTSVIKNSEKLEQGAEVRAKSPKNSKKEFIANHLAEIKAYCKGKNDVVASLMGRNVYCLQGSIRKLKNIEQNNKMGRRKYSVAYINSPGGDIDWAIEIGKEFHDNAAYVIVDQHCHSSCANYLIPSARRLYITNRTAITMHGSLPRVISKFVGIRFKNEMREALAGKKNTDLQALRAEQESAFDEYFELNVLREINFFRYIGKNEAYITRYQEIRRTLEKRKNYKCDPEKGLYLVVGPEYLKEFRIRTIREWFPVEKSEYAELLPNSVKNNSLIYDFDEHPFWLSGKGLVSPQYCLDAKNSELPPASESSTQ